MLYLKYISLQFYVINIVMLCFVIICPELWSLVTHDKCSSPEVKTWKLIQGGIWASDPKGLYMLVFSFPIYAGKTTLTEALFSSTINFSLKHTYHVKIWSSALIAPGSPVWQLICPVTCLSTIHFPDMRSRIFPLIICI